MTPPTDSSAPETANNVPAISAKGLVKTFTGRSGTVEAVRGVDLDVQTGEIFGFLGPNGAGKSTTVRMLTTLTGITGGSATVAGVDVAADPDGVGTRSASRCKRPASTSARPGVSCWCCRPGSSACRGPTRASVPKSCSSSSSSRTPPTG